MSDLVLHPTDLAWLRWVAGATMSTGILLAAAYALDVLLRRRVEARWRVLLPAIVLLRLALPLEWSSPLGVFGRHAAVAAAPEAVHSAVAVEPTRVAMTPSLATSAPPPGIPALAPLLHVGIALALLGAALAARWRASASLRDARPARESITRLSAGVPVVEHDALGPAVVGLVRPLIVMPSPLVEALAEEEVASVLRHEVAHVRRRDPLARMLVQLATFAAWPVLPAWLAASWLKGLVEQACDERALDGGGAQARGVHARALVDVATWRPRRLNLALGLLPFGEGVRARVRALRLSRRWATSAQVACVALLAPMLVLTLGARAAEPTSERASPRVAEATEAPVQARVPPVLRMKVERFRATPAIQGGGVPLLDDGEAVGEMLDEARAAALRRRLRSDAPGDFEVPIRSLLGGRMTSEVHEFIPPDGRDGFEEVIRFITEPAIAGPSIDLSLTTYETPGDRRREVTGRFAASGDALHVVRFADSEHGALHVMISLENAVFTAGGDARVESPRVSLDESEVPLADVAEAITRSTGISLEAIDAVAAKPITIRIDDLTFEDAVARLVDVADVEWELRGEAIRLSPRASVTQEPVPAHVVGEADAGIVARLRSILERDGVTVERIEPRPEKLLVVGRMSGGPKFFAAVTKDIEAQFASTEMDIFEPHQDGSFGFAMHLKWPVLVQVHADVVRLRAMEDVGALVATRRGPRQDDPRVELLIPSAALSFDFDLRLDELERAGVARAVTRPSLVNWTGQATKLTSEAGAESSSFAITTRGTDDAPVGDVTLELPWIAGGPIDAHLPVPSTLLQIAEPGGGVTIVAIRLQAVNDAP